MSISEIYSGHDPLLVKAPVSLAELRELVQESRQESRAIYPLGGSTMLGLGWPGSKRGTIVDLQAIREVIDYPARDMTITVQAGITVDQLQKVLQAERQQLAVDIPLPESATLGGAIATNASGSRRFGYGTLRDYIIGIRVVNDLGQEVSAGGRVVKNVAGYDMMKLYTGSLGTLGIITQVTLKLKPIPESSSMIVIPASLDLVPSILEKLLVSSTRPILIDYLNRSALCLIEEKHHLNLLPTNGQTGAIVIGYADNFKAVFWQTKQCQDELGSLVRDIHECTDGERLQLSAILRDFQLDENSELSLKANMVPSGVVEWCHQAQTLCPEIRFQVHAGNGIVYAHLNIEEIGSCTRVLRELTESAFKQNGNVTITRCPQAHKSALAIWGQERADLKLMKKIKQTLDPNNIFNPGRFVVG